MNREVDGTVPRVDIDRSGCCSGLPLVPSDGCISVGADLPPTAMCQTRLSGAIASIRGRGRPKQ